MPLHETANDDMPLSEPAEREPIHQRQIECRGYRRADGLWDIEGHLTDTKYYSFANHDRGEIKAGEPIHEMWLRLTVDDALRIHDVEARTEYGPFAICPQAAPNFARLRGLRIGPGFRQHVNERVGGVEGCTHLRELLGPLATTAFQTIMPIRARERDKPPAASRPGLLGTCYAYAADSEVVRRLWPRHYRPRGERGD